MKNNFLLFLLFLVATKNFAQIQNHNLIIGTYTKACDSKGIYVYNFDSKTGKTFFKAATDQIINPSFVSVNDNHKMLYSVNENGSESTVSAFGFDSASGKMTFLNQESSQGADPCHIINDQQNVLVSNYSGGSIAVFKKISDGSLSVAKQLIPHFGKGANAKRQQSPHVHQLQFSLDKKYVLATDLGNDRIYTYIYNPNELVNVLEIKDSIYLKPGSGPRHLTFSPDGKNVYLMQELDGKIAIFDFKNGFLKLKGHSTVVSKGFKGETSAADIHISPDGQFLYATNRGTANDISCFKIQKNGLLKFVSRTSTFGKGPRNFAIDPSGNFLLVAHQYTNNVVVFRRDLISGKLTNTKQDIELCSPVCLVFEP